MSSCLVIRMLLMRIVCDTCVARQTLSRFALTHEEIVARRRMLRRRYESQSASPVGVSVIIQYTVL